MALIRKGTARKIKLSAKPTAKPSIKRKATATKEAATSANAARAPRQSATRFHHDIKSTYTGVSPVTTSRKSRTALRSDDFGSAKHLVLSERDNALLTPLRRANGQKPFQRGDADVGILNRAIRKGILRHVGGDATHESAQLKFVGA